MKIKKLLSVIMVGVMMLTVFSGCGKKSGEVSYDDTYVMDPVLNPIGSDVFCKETVELEIMMPSNGNVQDYETNKFTKELERKGNVKLKFTLIPPTDAESKINLTLSSGKDLPDIVMYWLSDANTITYAEAGTFIPLNKYYENSSEYFVPQANKLNEERGIDLFEQITMPDGNIYGIPSFCESIANEYATVLWVYKPWLDKLGMSVPTNLQELETVLQAFKDNDLNGNGKNDEIPMIDCTENNVLSDILNSYIQVGEDMDNALRDTGKIDYTYSTEEYKEFLKYMRNLTSKGLFDMTSFSQDKETLKTLVNSSEVRVGVFSYTSTSILSSAKERRLDYVPMKIMHNNVAVDFHLSTAPYNFFITKDCEHPEVAFKIGDYMCKQEMTVWNRFGEPGVDWIEPTEGAECLYDFMGYEANMQTVLTWGAPQNSHWCNAGPGFRTTDVICGIAASNDDSQRAKANAVELMYDQYPKDGSLIRKLVYTSDELSERSSIKTALDPYIQQMRYEFITGKVDIDAGWNDYIKELKALNCDRLIEINQTAYDRMK